MRRMKNSLKKFLPIVWRRASFPAAAGDDGVPGLDPRLPSPKN